MRLLIIDGNSIVNRAFYGVRLLTNSEGLHTNAVYGFLSILFKLREDYPCDGVCVCFDRKEPTFRHKKYEGYKAKRKGMPDELAEQMPVLKEVLTLLAIPCFELPGYEADDLVGTISEKCAALGMDSLISSGDRDAFQLISESVSVLHVSTAKGQTATVCYTPETVREKYGFGPERIVDMKALMGDSSDEIPGVPGVGEKTALDLIARFGSIDEIYANLESLDIKDGLRKKLIEGEAMARLSYELAMIDKNAPIEVDITSIGAGKPDRPGLYKMFLKLGFKTFITRMALSEDGGETTGGASAGGFTGYRRTKAGELYSIAERLTEKETVFIAADTGLNAVALTMGEETIVALRADHGETEFEQLLNKLLSGEIQKAGHDIKPLMTALLAEGKDFGGFGFDTALGAYIINPSESAYTMERVAMAYLHTELPPASVYEKENAFSPLGGVEEAMEGLARHSHAVSKMYPPMVKKIKDDGMAELFYNVEQPLTRLLAEMQYTGFKVDEKALREFGENLAGRIEQCERRIYEYAGTNGFNIASTKQLGELLFEKLGLPASKKTKTGYSTDIEVLENLRNKHPVISEVIDYRQYTKLKSTYADGLMKAIGHDGRIHSSFNMTATATGRISSAEPNLQNIPVRQDLGSSIRRMFVPGEPGWVLIDADYSQIELRVLAHLADDPVMREAFLTGEDIHTVTASQVFGVAQSDVTSLMRRHAKAVNFGIVYGISDFSLSKDIGVTRAEAKRYMDSYFAKYAGVRAYMDGIIEKARADGYVTTLMGRRRYLPEIRSSNYNIRSFNERVALNTPVQGSAADIIKKAMVNVRERLFTEKFKTRLILQVHDELILEGPEDECVRAMTLLSEEMERVVELSVPLKADASFGKNWMEAKG